MLIAGIILSILALLFGGIAFAADDNDIEIVFALICGFFAFIAFAIAMHVQFSSQELTGYIYSSSDRGGYTTAHIRFSQNAGTDSQPEFCVKTDSDAGRAIQKYVGSDTKVKIDIPSYFYLANNPFACGTTNMTIQESK